MRVALVKAPPTYANWHRRPVFGLTYLSSNLKAHGHTVRIFDGYFHGWSPADLEREILRFDPEFIGFSAMTHEIDQCAEIAAGLRRSYGGSIVVGGCHATALPERTMQEYPVFDFAVVGEGELTLLELVQHLEGNFPGTVADIKGLVFRKDGRVCQNAPRPFLTSEELDALPFPDFSDYYGDNPRALAGKHNIYVIITSRGCPYRCAFCMQVLGHEIRARSQENILREIEFAIEHFGAHTIDFCDEIFLMNRPDTLSLLHHFVDSGLAHSLVC